MSGNLVIVGSLAHKMRNDNARQSFHDIDLMCKVDDFVPFVKDIFGTDNIKEIYPDETGTKMFAKAKGGMVIEAEIAWEGSTVEALIEYVKNDPETINVKGHMIPSLDMLYMLKMSHRYKKNSPHFMKTMKDIHDMRKAGARIPKKLKELYDRRRKDTYNYAHPNLKQSKKDFFTDTVPYVYDHDSIHRAVCEGEVPAYSLVKDVQDEVHMKKENFMASPLLVRLRCTLEESYVLSLERAIIPFKLWDDPEKMRNAFDMALMKVCTSITSGWFRQFSWENFHEVRGMYNPEYIEKFKAALERGDILPFTKEY